MPGPSAQPLSLTRSQYEILCTLLRQHTAPQRLVRRARIILAGADGLGLSETTEGLGINITTVQTWRNRWLAASERLFALEEDPSALAQAIEETLSDAPRSGAPLSFSAEEVAQIIALACEEPARYGRPVTHWTPDLLAEEVIKQGITESISPRTVGRFLKRSRAQTPFESVLAQPGG